MITLVRFETWDLERAIQNVRFKSVRSNKCYSVDSQNSGGAAAPWCRAQGPKVYWRFRCVDSPLEASGHSSWRLFTLRLPQRSRTLTQAIGQNARSWIQGAPSAWSAGFFRADFWPRLCGLALDRLFARSGTACAAAGAGDRRQGEDQGHARARQRGRQRRADQQRRGEIADRRPDARSAGQGW